MSLSLLITINVLADIALLAGLAYVMSRATRLDPHVASIDATRAPAAEQPPTQQRRPRPASSGRLERAAPFPDGQPGRLSRGSRSRVMNRGEAWAPQLAVNLAASSEPPVASPALYECAPAPARAPASTIRYSSRIGRPSK